MYLLFFTLLFLAPSFAHSAAVGGGGQLKMSTSAADSAPIRDLGRDTHRGVEARVQLEPQPLLDRSESLTKNLQHYLISVVFIDIKTGKELVKGQVAARTITTIKRISKTVRLEAKPLRWTGMLILPTKGETLIKIGSKLGDGKKRIYRFFYDWRSVVAISKDMVPSG